MMPYGFAPRRRITCARRVWWLAVIFLLIIGNPLAGESAEQVKRIDLAEAIQASRAVVVENLGALASGGKQAWQFDLKRIESMDLRVTFADAPFSGTQLNAQINGKRLLPYFAFGGDTRYDNVKDKTWARSPVATIEGRWLIPTALLRQGKNELVLWTTGVRADPVLQRIGPRPMIRISSVTIRRADGSRLPTYSNSIYYDFSVWPQGYAGGGGYNYDQALLGVINGKGMRPVIAPLLPVQA